MVRGVGSPGKPALLADLSVLGLERAMLARKQMECPYFGVIYAAVQAATRSDGGQADAKHAVTLYAKERPDHMLKRKVDAVVRASEHYELVNDVLMKRVYDLQDNEV